MQINIEPLVAEKLKELFKVLLEENYFFEIERAVAYTNALRKFIHSIPTRACRKTKNNQYGSFYASYKPNRHTTWYVTFDVFDEDYIIRNIINNHTSEYPEFIASLRS